MTFSRVRSLPWFAVMTARRRLPSYMVPEMVEFREEMPRTSTGKVDRTGLARERNELEPTGDGRRNKR